MEELKQTAEHRRREWWDKKQTQRKHADRLRSLISLGSATLHRGDCHVVLSTIATASVSLVIFDPPYGMTAAKWDRHLDYKLIVSELERVLTPLGTVVAFGSEGFTHQLHAAFSAHGRQLRYRYSRVWRKTRATGFLHAANRPLKDHEDIMIFSKGVMGHPGEGSGKTLRRMTYNPQGLVRLDKPARGRPNGCMEGGVTRYTNVKERREADIFTKQGRSTLGVLLRSDGSEHQLKKSEFTNYPASVMHYASEGRDEYRHPTRKPLALLDELVRTYSNEGELVLDPTMGVGSSGVACIAAGREFVGMELGEGYFRLAAKRMQGLSSAPSKPREKTSPTLDRIVCGDALETLQSMSDACVDLVVTSPPYNLRNSTGKQGSAWRGGSLLASGYDDHSDDMDHDAYVEWQRAILKECMRVLRPKGAIFYNHKRRSQGGVMQDRSDILYGLPVRQQIIWDRGSSMNFSRAFFLPTTEDIYLIAKPGFQLVPGAAGQLKDVWRIAPERNTEHPAPFPLELASRCIRSTDAAVVLDPFMGSGTTALAARLHGRSFVGIELSRKYVEIADRRLAEQQIAAAA